MSITPSQTKPLQQQQKNGVDSADFQPGRDQSAARQRDDDKAQQIGEGSYEDTRDHHNSIESYLKNVDVKSDVRAAKPGSLREALALQKAEQEGKSHSKAAGQ